MKKRVFIINGSGGVGKDTICAVAARFWRTRNISSITPILAVARAAGWDGVKTPAARRLLSQLKEACTAYNDLSFTYCMEQYHAFIQGNEQLLFVHIREPEEIVRFQQAVGDGCESILVRRPSLEAARGRLGNRSDDGVTDYCYDHVFDNDMPLDILPERVRAFFARLLE